MMVGRGGPPCEEAGRSWTPDSLDIPPCTSRQHEIPDPRRQSIILPSPFRLRRSTGAFNGFHGVERSSQGVVGHVRGRHGMSDRACHRNGGWDRSLARGRDRIHRCGSRLADRCLPSIPVRGHAQGITEPLVELRAVPSHDVSRALAGPGHQQAMLVQAQGPTSMPGDESLVSHDAMGEEPANHRSSRDWSYSYR
jgi:hypothetical protein